MKVQTACVNTGTLGCDEECRMPGERCRCLNAGKKLPTETLLLHTLPELTKKPCGEQPNNSALDVPEAHSPPINTPHQSHSAPLSTALMSQNILRPELSEGGILSWWSSILYGPPQLPSALRSSKNSALGVISRVMEVGKWWTHVSLRVVMISYFRLMERDTATAAQETSPLLSISNPPSPWYTLKQA